MNFRPSVGKRIMVALQAQIGFLICSINMPTNTSLTLGIALTDLGKRYILICSISMPTNTSLMGIALTDLGKRYIPEEFQVERFVYWQSLMTLAIQSS